MAEPNELDRRSIEAAMIAISKAHLTNRFEVLGGAGGPSFLTFGNAISAELADEAGNKEQRVEVSMHSAVLLDRGFALALIKKLVEHFNFSEGELTGDRP